MAGIKYFVPIEVAGPTGAVAATRYAGGTTSGAPASGSFLLGDFVVAQDGHIWVCTAAGSPGTWADAGALANPLPVDLVISGDGSAGTTPSIPGVSLGVEVGGNNNAHMEIASPASTGVAYQDFTVVGQDYRVRQYWDEGGAVYGVAVPSLSHTLTIDSDGLKMDGVLIVPGATLPDPSGEPDGEWLMTSSGAAVWVPAAANLVPITDVGGYFTSTDVEGALQELGAGGGGGGAVSSVFGRTGTVTAQSGDYTAAQVGALPSTDSPGLTQLVYRYTVTGSDKASIDTGVDTPDAGSNVWTNGDVLEVLLYLRTDEAVVKSGVNMTLNNDTTSIYDRTGLINDNTTVGGISTVAQANWPLLAAGANCASGVFAPIRMTLPNYGGTTGNKFAEMADALIDTTQANNATRLLQFGYRSTTAISRLAIAPATSGKKLKVGSQLLIYKRLAS